MPASAGAVAAAAAAGHRHHAEQARARKEHCLKVDKEFVSQSATAKEKQEYIACQQVLAPPPAPQPRNTDGGDFALKVGGGIVLVWLLVGAIAFVCTSNARTKEHALNLRAPNRGAFSLGSAEVDGTRAASHIPQDEHE